VQLIRSLLGGSPLKFIAVAACAATLSSAARAEAWLVVEADSGRVLQAENATMPWYPASVTKIMTAYVVLKAVKEGRMSLDQTLTVSPVAASQSPSKMGFKPGTLVTVENALAMMMVKSANDMAVVLAEGAGRSVDGFSAMMNQTAQRLGMSQTTYVNPNGLPADGQVTSARDLAILARAVIRDLPEYEYFMHIPAIRFGRRTTANFNRLIGRYPGADGFKTGFICASGYNLVASATRNGKRLIAVVLGSSSGQARAVRAAQLLERGFGNTGLSWLRPSMGTVDSLAPIDATPPNLREEMCNGRRKRPASDEDEASLTVAASSSATGGEAAMTFFTAGLQAPMPKASEVLLQDVPVGEPMVVYTGPKRTGAALIAAVATDSEKQATRRGKRSRTTAKKPDGAAEPKAAETRTAAKPDQKPAAKPDQKAAKPKAQHASAKPETAVPAKPADKPVSSAAKPAQKPLAAAQPAAAPKPAATAASKPAASAKPAAIAKPKPETKPAS
jgi:D-alanyl-D-alanine carboxypeptidase